METISKQAIEIGDLLNILRRRKYHFLAPFLAISIAAAILAYVLPPAYVAEATILIERQEIPEDLVQTTITGYVQERLQGLQKRLLTRNNLFPLAEKFNLYTAQAVKENPDQVAQELREAIVIEMVDVEAREPGGTRQGIVTVAFTVSFEHEDPQMASDMANALTGLILEENQRYRSERAARVSEFLQREAEELRSEIAKLEAELAEFKQQQRDQLPELRDVNLRLYEKTEGDIARTEENIRTLEDRKLTIEAELTVTDPYKEIVTEEGNRVQSPSERLNVLTTEYLKASSSYASNHPDLVKLRREINALAGQSDSGSDVHKIFRELTVSQSQLTSVREKYSDEHPDVIKLKGSISDLEQALIKATSAVRSASSALPVNADNPVYVSLKTQLDSLDGGMKAERAKLAQLNQKLNEYQTRLFQTPVVERDYQLLTRDYDNARDKYREIKEKLLGAKMAQGLEEDSRGERFTVIQKAFPPSMPDKPNRLGIFLLGFLLGFTAGIGSVSLAEYNDQSIWGSKGVAEVFGAPPLAAIPVIPDELSR